MGGASSPELSLSLLLSDGLGARRAAGLLEPDGLRDLCLPLDFLLGGGEASLLGLLDF